MRNIYNFFENSENLRFPTYITARKTYITIFKPLEFSKFSPAALFLLQNIYNLPPNIYNYFSSYICPTYITFWNSACGRIPNIYECGSFKMWSIVTFLWIPYIFYIGFPIVIRYIGIFDPKCQITSFSYLDFSFSSQRIFKNFVPGES